MKKLLFVLLIPFVMNGQARLGRTEYEIRADFPDRTIKRDWTKDGLKYLMVRLDYGVFIYYFDANGYTDFNIYVPETLGYANAQAEIYNKKYVITSNTSWTAYLTDGGIMKIYMIYDDQLQKYIFKYEN